MYDVGVEINIHEAKNKLSSLIERALNGEDSVIAKAGKPLVRLVSVEKSSHRIFGSAEGTIEFGSGWDAPLTDEELQEFLS